jgi:hypothetical protein
MLVSGSASVAIPTLMLRQVCGLLTSNPSASPHNLKCKVSKTSLRLFADAVNGESVEVTESNARELAALSLECDFKALSAKVAAFEASPAQQYRIKIGGLEAEVAHLRPLVKALRRTIRVFHLKPDPTKLPTGSQQTDFSKLTALTKKFPDFRIKVHVREANGFTAVTLCELIDQFDIIFVGGSDRSFDGLTTIGPEITNRTLKPFIDAGGAILLFHDVVGDAWNFIYDQFRFERVEMIRMNTASAFCSSRVTNTPFLLSSPLDIGETHGYNSADRRHTVFEAGNVVYHARVGRVGYSEMCHVPPSTDDEWKLLVNIVYDFCTPRTYHRDSVLRKYQPCP